MAILRPILIVIVFWLVSVSSFASKQNVVRFATVAPHGSPWSEEIIRTSQEMLKKTNGKLYLKVYDSMKMGDEPDYLRKMRSGQLHSASFTGYGLSLVDKSVLVMELPFVFRDRKEADYVYEKMFPFFAKRFKNKGLILLNFTTYGDVNFITTKPIQKLNDFPNIKMWAWEGDPLIENFFKALNIPTISLPITEVLTGLQTGMVEGVYAPPLASVAFQWWTKTNYISSPPFRSGVLAFMVTDKKWNSLTPNEKELVKNLLKNTANNISTIGKKDNEEALQVLLKNNQKLVPMEKENLAQFVDFSKTFRKDMVGKIYDQAALTELEKQIASYRSQKN